MVVPGRRPLGLQARLTVVATALVAAVLMAGAVLLALLLQRTLLGTLEDSARQRAADVAVLVDRGTLPTTVSAAGGTVLVQVVDARGRVVAATPGGDALVPLLSARDRAAVRRGKTRDVPGSRVGVSDTLRVVGTTAGPATDRQTVIVAVSSGEALRSLRAAEIVLAVGVPLLVAGFALVCWLLVGAALRPVEALRRGADEVSRASLTKPLAPAAVATTRLPVPATRDEVARLAETLNDMLDRLAAGGVRQRAFVADAAHELRSPLASIRTQLEVGRAHPQVTDWADTADGVLVDVARLTRLVDDLLLLARLDDARRPVPTAGPLDLRDVAQEAVDPAGRQWPITLTAPSEPVLVSAGADAVRRILENLLSNADRYARAAVALAVTTDGDAALLTVSDDGPGIPAEQRARVFERFTRLESSRDTGSGGSGLGLAIVAQLTASLGGTVELHDAEPGLRVVVRLPRSPH